jgi:hypothetical protein
MTVAAAATTVVLLLCYAYSPPAVISLERARAVADYVRTWCP